MQLGCILTPPAAGHDLQQATISWKPPALMGHCHWTSPASCLGVLRQPGCPLSFQQAQHTLPAGLAVTVHTHLSTGRVYHLDSPDCLSSISAMDALTSYTQEKHWTAKCKAGRGPRRPSVHSASVRKEDTEAQTGTCTARARPHRRWMAHRGQMRHRTQKWKFPHSVRK